MSVVNSQVQAAWQILEGWAEGNDATILETRKKVVEVLRSELEPNAVAVCDVLGCGREVSSGGCGWRETGYWQLCSNHSREADRGSPRPAIKDEAIKRESRRLPGGYYPPTDESVAADMSDVLADATETQAR